MIQCCEQAAKRTLAASLEWLPEFEIVSHEVAALGIPEFEVSTAKRSRCRPSMAKSYSRALSSKLLPPVVRETLPESKVYIIPQRQVHLEVWTPPATILKHPDHMRDEPPQAHVELIQICPEYPKASTITPGLRALSEGSKVLFDGQSQ